MDTNRTRHIAAMLMDAARRKRLVTYQELHALFGRDEPLQSRYRALEDAARSLSDCASLDYRCLMSLDNGLPGDDFFNRFRHGRPREYEEVMGFGSAGRSTTRKRLIADAERRRVFEHASQMAASGSATGAVRPYRHATRERPVTKNAPQRQ
ncbi:hypothetical protein LJ655_00205 [Paraburkholderia sp. MMS20-SJTN17]|uniref:Uncharacterized protein n=1 Tax=Paraburkholderia translucens TaxID=2886945 RepID=A0ABS8K6J0_9BURK|nr:hypothetical protein [Paraburkholderia sp. MMS20-SJTN17]MCC8400324.1 hypothetical protein [Paraburkholderia sp. MMS20-SJTN17]